jgi:hypothetical protein
MFKDQVILNHLNMRQQNINPETADLHCENSKEWQRAAGDTQWL